MPGEPLESLEVDLPASYVKELEERKALKKGVVPKEETFDFSRGEAQATDKQLKYIGTAYQQGDISPKQVDKLLGTSFTGSIILKWYQLTKSQASEVISWIEKNRKDKTKAGWKF